MREREELYRLIGLRSDEEVEDVLRYVQWLRADEEEITDEELAAVEAGEREIARGDYVTLEELRRSLTPHGR